MPTLSIDLTEEEHRRLVAGAARTGSSVGDYVRSRILADADAMAELAAVLAPRIERADAGQISQKSIADVAKAARAKLAG